MGRVPHPQQVERCCCCGLRRGRNPVRGASEAVERAGRRLGGPRELQGRRVGKGMAEGRSVKGAVWLKGRLSEGVGTSFGRRYRRPSKRPGTLPGSLGHRDVTRRANWFSYNYDTFYLLNLVRRGSVQWPVPFSVSDKD